MTDTETVLVTGGTGFVGSHLARTMVDDGHGVVAFDPAGDRALLEHLGVADAVRIVEGDVTDVAALARAVRETGATRLVHLAALLSEDVRADALDATRVNVVGTNDVLEVARLFPDRIDRVVLTSSETVYAAGSRYGDAPVEEDALLRPDSPYSAAKRYAECLAETYAREYDVPVVTLRPTGVFGPYRRSFTAFSDLFEKPALGEPARIEAGETAVSWLHVKDAAEAFRRATLVPEADLEHRIYNVRGEVATVSTAAETVRELVPGGSVTVEDDSDLDWSAQHLSLSRSRADLGYEIGYDLAALVRDYADVIRRDAGLGPIG